MKTVERFSKHFIIFIQENTKDNQIQTNQHRIIDKDCVQQCF